MRIVSLLPSITEIVSALGMKEHLVGRSHECDYPTAVSSLPSLTSPRISTGTTGAETDEQVQTLVSRGLSVYEVNAERLASLEPDLILTQDHCEACAVSYHQVEEAVRTHLGGDVTVISISPGTLDEVFLSIEQIAGALGADSRGEKLIHSMITGFNRIRSKTARLPAPGIVCIEWIEPLMSAGNWVPELVSIAGGISQLGTAGQKSEWIAWEAVMNADPDILLISPCGYTLEQTADEIQTLAEREGWNQLQAVQHERVYLVEGHHFFHRPGPRLLDSAEILAELFHPGIFDRNHHETGWINLNEL
ncbi:MAG: cobalamin-binding protein [Balneolaceae bacterium]|nr:cobalamin-binding protein [Balneolaceae bacterium]